MIKVLSFVNLYKYLHNGIFFKRRAFNDVIDFAFDDTAKKQSAFVFEIYQNGPSKLIVSENE